HFIGRTSSDRPEFAAGERFDGTTSPVAATRAFSIYFCDQPPAGGRDRAFAAQKRWNGKRLCARDRRAKCASVFNRTVDHGNAGLSRRQSPTGHHAARSRIDFDRSGGEAAGAIIVAAIYDRRGLLDSAL